MPDKAIEIYLNDHLGGAMLGSALAEQIRDYSEGTSFEAEMAKLAREIEEDRQALLVLMDALDISRNPVKQVTGWLAEKASTVKFSGAASGDPDHGFFMALETLRLGVTGKKCMWIALAQVREAYPDLTEVDLDSLIERASAQEQTLERERLAAAARALNEAAA